MPFGPIEEQVRRVAGSSSGGLSVTFIASLGLALWSANAGMKAIIDALNVAYDEDEKRSFIKLTLVSLLLHARRDPHGLRRDRRGRGVAARARLLGFAAEPRPASAAAALAAAVHARAGGP